jgi:glycine dehydrogenase subunit 2
MIGPGPFHQARWCEPIVCELGGPGQRGVVPPPVAPEIERAAGDVLGDLPADVRRAVPPALPEIAQPEVFRHYLRLSQETLGAAVGGDIGQGTATMKFSPPAHEGVVRASQLPTLHPLADEGDIQGLLDVVHRFEGMLCEISGMARFSFQPGGGTHGIYANACIMRAFHAARGEHRDEVITTVYSHPADAAAPATAGFRVITIYPGERGYVELDAVLSALSERTAGLMIANPEDTGIFNPEIDRIVAAVHDAGGLCAYDWANANGLLGIVRPGDSGFDLCQLNLHKTFGSPHAAGGLACGAIGATDSLAPFLPVPLVAKGPNGYHFEHDSPQSIGIVRAFHGVIGTVMRSYAWVAALGPEGLRRVAESAVLNNNYLAHRLAELGFEPAYAGENRSPRLEQIRYSLAALAEETGVGTDDVARRSADHGVTGFFSSHHPWLVPEPATLEPTETPTRADLDAYAAILSSVVSEARDSPELVHHAPEHCAIHRIDEGPLDNPSTWALTWRAHLRNMGAREVQLR